MVNAKLKNLNSYVFAVSAADLKTRYLYLLFIFSKKETDILLGTISHRTTELQEKQKLITTLKLSNLTIRLTAFQPISIFISTKIRTFQECQHRIIWRIFISLHIILQSATWQIFSSGMLECPKCVYKGYLGASTNMYKIYLKSESHSFWPFM